MQFSHKSKKITGRTAGDFLSNIKFLYVFARLLQLVANVEALMHCIAGLTGLYGVADNVNFGDEGLELFGQRIVLSGTKAEDDVVEALEPFLAAVLVLNLYIMLGDFENLGVDVGLDALTAQTCKSDVPVGQAHAGHELRLHLNERDLDIADAAGGSKGVGTCVSHEHFCGLACDFAAAEDADGAFGNGDLAAEDIVGGDDGIVADTLDEGGDKRGSAGCNNNSVRSKFTDGLNGCFLLELELYAGLLCAVVEVSQPLAHFLLAGRDNGEIELAADLLALLPHGHIVAALGSGDSGVHAAGACADDENFLGGSGGIEREVILVTDERVDVALADRMMGILRGDAAAAAGAAGSDIVEAVLICLLRQVGIGEQGTAHGYAVYQATLHEVCCVADVVYLADGKHGDIDDLLDFGGLIYVLADLLAVRGKYILQILVLDAAGDLKHIYAGCLKFRCKVEHLVKAVAAGNALGTGDAQDYREVAADISAALLDYFKDQAGAVVNAAAVLVHTLVAQGREKSAGEHVGVCNMQGDTAAAGFLCTARGLTVLLYDLVDLVDSDRSADSAVCVRVDGGTQGLDALECAYGLGTRMDKLREQRAAGVAYALCKCGKLRNEGILVKCSSLADVPVFVVDGDSINNNVACAAFSTAHKDVRQLFGNGAVSRLIVHAHRSHGYAVFESGPSQLQRRKDFRVFHVGYHVVAS